VNQLGKKPARPDAVKLRLGAYFKEAVLPVAPDVFPELLVQNWRMLGNDIMADCVQAGAAHETMQIILDAGRAPPLFTPTTMANDYRAVNPTDTNYSGGTDVQVYAKYRQDVGILDASGMRHKIDIYAALRVGDTDQLALATFLFGAVGVGFALPANAETQFDYGQVWTVEPNSPADQNRGHYVPCVGRNWHGNFLFVTWGRLQAATPAWVRMYMDEAVAVFSREQLNEKGLSAQGYLADQLNEDFAQVTA
jgi:hypothetical protein